jgi:hypothetical protein
MSNAAIGYLVQGGPAPGISDLHIVACSGPNPKSEGIHIIQQNVMGPGMFFGNGTTFVDALGTPWTALMIEVNVTKLGPVGDTIEGNYFGSFGGPGQPLLNVKGDFHVCHTPDQEVP